MSSFSRAWRNSRFYRRITTMLPPKLLIIGAQKCGTSALFDYLAQHPRFSPARTKEVEFFGSDLLYSYGWDWYIRYWERIYPLRPIRFEASPIYMANPKAAQRIRSCMPRVKLIAMLRDPVARAYSAWHMYREQIAEVPDYYDDLQQRRHTAEESAGMISRDPAELDDFSLAVEREIACLERGEFMQMSVVALGLYGPQLKRYYDHFPREQLLVLDSQDLHSDRVETLNRVLRFVGQRDWDWSRCDLRERHIGPKAAPMPARTRDLLREYYRDSNRLLAKLVDTSLSFARDNDDHSAAA